MTHDVAPWIWLAAGVLTCAAEALAPGMFLLWIGLAAIVTGLISFAVSFSGPVALLVFALCAIVCVAIGRFFYGSRDIASDRPNLNRRADQLIGEVLVLEEPIENGAGRARVKDSLWRVVGPDLPKGARVRVASIEASVTLRVEAA